MSKARYDDIAAYYDSAIRPLERWFLGRLRKQAFDNLPKTGRILELGAGTGANFCYYPSQVAVVATDLSREMLNIAGHKRQREEIVLVQSRAEDLPFKKNSFDAALATLVFCSVESPEQAFMELRRVVKPGGAIVLLEHVRPGGLLGPIFDLINLVTAPLLDDSFNRRTADTARASGLAVTCREKRMLGIMNLIVCRV